MTRLLYSTLPMLALCVFAMVLFSASTNALPSFLTPTPTHPLTDLQAQGLFVEFTKRYGKQYAIEDLFKRYNIFRENVEWIINFNNDKSNTHQVGVNFFADLTEEEWPQYKGILIQPEWKEPDYRAMDKVKDTDDKELQAARKQRGEVGELPAAFDWEEKGALEPIRNQGSCGSCYSQAAVCTIEALHHINFPDEKDLGFFSTQQGVDCTGSRYGCSGCGGGWMTSVYRMLIDAGGVCSDESYPYTGRMQRCRFDNCEKVFSFHNYREISGAKESSILEHLVINPLSIAVTSNNREFMYYKSGVISRCGSTSAQIDHAIVAIGYDKDADVPYVRIRNSWGTSWGDKGYAKLALNKNMCKWRANVSYPVLNSPQEPAQQPLAQPQPAQRQPAH